MAEKEYIDREILLKMNFYTANCNSEENKWNDYAIKDIIRHIPAADVAPIRHGHWIDKPYPNYPAHDIRYCSECGWNIHKSKLRNSDLNWSYCPNCGAKMDF